MSDKITTGDYVRISFGPHRFAYAKITDVHINGDFSVSIDNRRALIRNFDVMQAITKDEHDNYYR